MNLIDRNSPISAGRNHYGIIDEKENLYMVGKNSFGQLGVGRDIGKSKIPILVKFPGESQKVISISAYDRMTGAVTKDGKVYVWGDNEEGRFFPNQDNIWLPREVILPSAEKATKIVINYLTYLVLLEDFSVYFSSYIYTDTDDLGPRGPIRRHLKLDAIDISLSMVYGALISKDHKLYSWWDIDIDQRIPIQLPESVIKVAMGDYHMITLSTTGKVYIVGWEIWDKLDIDNPVLIKFPEKIVQIDAMNHYSAVVSETGRLYIWGIDEWDKFINDPTGGFSPPEISLGFPVNYIALGPEFNIAVTDDQIVNYWEKWPFPDPDPTDIHPYETTRPPPV